MSPYENIFRVTGPLCVEFTGHRWISLTKASEQSFDVLFDLHLNKQLSKQSARRWFEMSLRSLWPHCNVFKKGWGRMKFIRFSNSIDKPKIAYFLLWFL